MTIEFNQLGAIESFYSGFEEDFSSDLYERDEDVSLPDEAVLEEETTLDGALDAIRFINPISLK